MVFEIGAVASELWSGRPASKTTVALSIDHGAGRVRRFGLDRVVDERLALGRGLIGGKEA